ncbi:MAG TPA: hypothetical protein VGR66_10810 [Candidatus Eisenbacteria bacterium]|nr:hypothetical protein [Candidatus Eisenbacteria bacterium]
MRATLPTWLPLALVLAAAAATHAAVLRAPFFADDYLFLDQVRARPLVDALVSPDPLGNFLRPVGRQLHFWIWSHATGESPLAFHVVNLLVFLGAVVLLYEIARRLAGRGPAFVAAAFLALQYAADVPLLWASGSQDLLALTLGLGAILLAMEDQNVAAAFVFLLAVLSKETAAAVPLLCLVAGRRSAESWTATLRRQAPILVALAAWAGAWLATLGTRHASPAGAPAAGAAMATLVHALQVALGFEWQADNPLAVLAHPLVWLPPAAAGLAAWWAARSARPSRRLWVLGSAVALLGALPVIAVASIWSAYFYLLAMAGVGLLLGAACGRSPGLAAAVVFALGFTSANARLTEEFSTALGPWTRLSHVNRFYLDRAMTKVARYLEQMKEQEPTLPPRSTIFFGNFPGFLGWQAGDGPLARWAYRDSSVRSYYVSGFDRAHAARGPYYFFVIRNDSLVEIRNKDALLQDLWYTHFLYQDWTAAQEIIHAELPLTHHPQFVIYWLGWTEYALGDTAKAYALLRPFKMSLTRGPSPELPAIDAAIAARDTMAAFRALSAAIPRHALDATLHGRMSDLLVARRDGLTLGGLEASLTTVLDSTDILGWRRLATLQLLGNGPYEAKRSLDRYFALGGTTARGDSLAVALERLVEAALPGGALVQRGIRR